MFYFSLSPFQLYFWGKTKTNKNQKCGLLQGNGCLLKQHIMERYWLRVNFVFNLLDIKTQADN